MKSFTMRRKEATSAALKWISNIALVIPQTSSAVRHYFQYLEAYGKGYKAFTKIPSRLRKIIQVDPIPSDPSTTLFSYGSTRVRLQHILKLSTNARF